MVNYPKSRARIGCNTIANRKSSEAILGRACARLHWPVNKKHEVASICLCLMIVVAGLQVHSAE